MSRARWLVYCAVFAAFFGAAALVGSLVDLRTDLSFVFPHSADPETQLVIDRMQQGPASSIILLAISGGSQSDLARASNALGAAMRESGLFYFVFNGGAELPKTEAAFVFRHRSLLAPNIGPETFSPSSIRKHLEEALALLATSEGRAVRALLPSDPIFATRDLIALWLGGDRSGKGSEVWLSKDAQKALLMVRTKADGFNVEAQKQVIDFIRGKFATIPGAETLRLDLTGPSVFALQSSDKVRREMYWLTAASSVLVAAVLFFAMRSVRLMLITSLPISAGVVAGAAVVQLAFGYVHGVTLTFGATLLGVAVDYPIHLVGHMGPGESAEAAMKRIWRPLLLALVTTMVAYIPITASTFPGLSQIGLFTLAGLVTSAAVTRWLLPPMLPPRDRGIVPSWAPGVRLPYRAVFRIVGVVLGLAAAAFIASRGSAMWENDLARLSPIPDQSRALDTQLRTELAAPDVRYLLAVREPTVDAVLRRTEQMRGDLQRLVAEGAVAGFDMASRYLPSQAAQETRRKALPDWTTLRLAFDQALAGLPFRPEAFAPFFADVEASRSGRPVTLDDFRNANLGWRLDPYLFRYQDEWVGLIVPSGVTDPGRLERFVRERAEPGFFYLDLKRTSEKLAENYRNEALGWLFLGAGLGVAILFAGLRNLRRLIGVVTPVVLAAAMTIAILLAFGVKLSILHLLSLLLIFGVGLDYALFLSQEHESAEDHQRSHFSAILCNVTTVSLFALLAFSNMPILHGIGLTVAVGTTLCLLLAFVFAAQSPAKRSQGHV